MICKKHALVLPSVVLFIFTCVSADSSPPRPPPLSKLIGGSYYDLTHTPMALIRTSTYECTGILVGERLVLTAGHCIQAPASDYTVYVGGSGMAVSEANYNPLFNMSGSVDLANNQFDLGMLVLQNPVTTVDPATVITQDPLRPGDQAAVVGFGTSERTGDTGLPPPGIGKIGRFTIEQSVQGMLTSSLLYSSASTCPGDSGGPLIQFLNNGEFALVAGTVSFGTNKDDYFGNCVVGGEGAAAFVDLQSAASQTFLSTFSGVRYLSGRAVDFFLSIRRADTDLAKLATKKNYGTLTSSSNLIQKKLFPLVRLADPRRLVVLKKMRRELAAAAKATSTKAALVKIKAAKEDSATLVSYYVN